MRIPSATYRLQFNADFGFAAADRIVDYLAELGISDLYASPIFKARAGSTHGYDVVDPTSLNPELGSPADFSTLAQHVSNCNMGWLQDIIPNHMAFAYDNHMLMDVLELGKASAYYQHFDIDWQHPYETMRGRLLAPFLGRSYGESMREREITVRYSAVGFTVHYYGWTFPLNMESYGRILSLNLDQLKQRLGSDHTGFIKFMGMLYVLQVFSDQDLPGERYDQRRFVKNMLWELYQGEEEIKRFIDRNLDELNGRMESQAPNLLDELLFDQFFRLSFWKVAGEEVNYRRFFNINELISVRIENEEVFANCHRLILKLVQEGVCTGLRIDHIDGLYDPQQYLQRLQEKAGGVYITVEKILALGEQLPSAWQTEGTTGYDSLNYINGLFCQINNRREMDRVYTRFTGCRTDYEELLSRAKQIIIERYMSGDVDNLAHLMKKASSRDRQGWDITLYGLKRAIREMLVHFPVYRTYVNPESFGETDRAIIATAAARAKTKNPDLIIELDYLEKFLLLQSREDFDSEQQTDRLKFVMRFQQFTGPLMAKGFEDTTLYVYNRLISLNEVGGEPYLFGISLEQFHQFNRERMANWPHAMTTTSTHDTKRSEDVRARINVLSELPKEWETRVKSWRTMNKSKKKRVNKRVVPDGNDEYFFYQTLIGVYPPTEAEHQTLVARIKDYSIKAIREAKVHTGWLKPDSDYEDAYLTFIDRVLESSPTNDFLQDFVPFQNKVAHYGMLNSLAQTILKITLPGVPDFYQGTELWSFTLVDPDNRRPVDYNRRRQFLQEIRHNETQPDYLEELKAAPQDGKLKLFLIYRALKARNDYRALFDKGAYLPLAVEGQLEDHLIACARHDSQSWAITIAPRFFAGLVEPGKYPLGSEIWHDTRIVLPDDCPSEWQETISSGEITARAGVVLVGEALQRLPVALLVNSNRRRAYA